MTISDSQIDVASSAAKLPLPQIVPTAKPSPPALPKRRPQPRDEKSKAEAPAVRRGAALIPPPASPPPSAPPAVQPAAPAALPPAVPPPAVAEASPLAPPPTAEAAEAADGQTEKKLRFGWLFAVPSWLVSAIVHLVALLIMALIMLPLPQSDPEKLLIVIDPDQIAEPLVVTSVVQIDTAIDNLSVTAAGVASDDVASADLGESLATLPRTDNGPTLANVEATLQDLGVLFGTKGTGLTQHDANGKGAEFFGVKAGGRKFVFIVDSSNSMKNGKFDAARRELEYAIRRLDKNQFFYVIFFDHDAARMTFAPNKEPEERAVPANSTNIRLAEAWMSAIENELRTDPFDAVKYALEMLPDAIYILSDGKFTDKGKTEQYLARNNNIDDPIDGKRPKVVVHTVGFYSRDGEETLEGLAKAYGGTYRFVPPPPGFKGKK